MSQLALHDEGDGTGTHGGSGSGSGFGSASPPESPAAAPSGGVVPEQVAPRYRTSRAPVRASVYFPDYDLDSPTIGRSIHVPNPALASYGSLPSPSSR